MNTPAIVQGLFAIQLTLLGLVFAATGSGEFGVLCGVLGVFVGLISLAGTTKPT